MVLAFAQSFVTRVFPNLSTVCTKETTTRPCRFYRPAVNSASPYSMSSQSVEIDGSAITPKARKLLAAYAEAPLYQPDVDDESADKQDLIASIAQGVVSGPLKNHADDLIKSARIAIEESYPGISHPGGALYPALRAESCWRDLACFLATSAAVETLGGKVRPAGITALRALYDELSVPLDALETGLIELARCARNTADADITADALELIAEQLVV